MLALLVSLVPVAVAGAMSTVPASITIIILLSSHPRRRALAFLIGTITGSVVIVGLSSVGLGILSNIPRWSEDEFQAALGLVIGAFLIGYAVYLLRRKGTRESAMLGKITAKFQSARTWEFIGLGLGLNLRPKALVLAVTAGALISVQDPSPIARTLLVLGYAVLAQSAVVVPILYWVRSPERAEGQLAAVYAWLQRNGRFVTAATILAIGAFIAGYSLLQA
ncbi:GAP family protein [Arthrobacter sulfonylureivorans]|uniref:GAP family protein n=1 Tax=Arthrobacter sulfonylureivorans TaxID=2486855 RepID=UPI0039E3993E